jgi:lysozyme family protein
MAEFRPALEKTLRWEGGETVDTGGYTKWGISQKAYPSLDIKNMTHEQAVGIYRRDYWNKIQGDLIISQAVANVIFDWAVNAGTGAATKQIQKILGLKQDGGFGPVTLAAVNRRGPALANEITQARRGFYERLAAMDPAKYAKYLRGWLKRADDFFFETADKAGQLAPVAIIGALVFWLYRRNKRA